MDNFTCPHCCRTDGHAEGCKGATTADLVMPDAPDLHDQIMRLPCAVPNHDGLPYDFSMAYRMGHRDARHAAAELAAAAIALVGEGAVRMLCDTPELRDLLKEITLCYPWGTETKLVRDNTTRNWHTYSDKTKQYVYLPEWQNNLVNSAIAATVSAINAPACAARSAEVKWISVRDSLPPIHTDILLTISTGEVVMGCRGGEFFDWPETNAEIEADGDVNVTHWQPLPAPAAIKAQGSDA